MKLLMSAFLPTILVTFGTFAHAQVIDQAMDKENLREVLQGNASIEVNKRVRLNQDVKARVYGKLNEGNTSSFSVELPHQAELEVLELSNDGKVAHIGIDSDVSSISDLYVSTDDLQNASLTEINTDSDETADDDDGGEGLFAGRKKKGGMTYCYRDVKTTLLKNKKCGRYASGVRAAEGYQILANECGMQQVGIPKSLKELPAYSVCVSGGGRPCGGGKACGHIAIKLPNGMWFGAGTRGTPFLGDSKKAGYVHRYAIGCLKPKGAK